MESTVHVMKILAMFFVVGDKQDVSMSVDGCYMNC